MIQLNNQIKVIQKKDSDFPEHLDFDVLRREGLLHIGALSGKIWTDHNIHDPGVTILEMLCYALMDLGYRSQLSIPDLMAQKPHQSDQTEDNFLSPAQILTNNPISILDFRKMLMDIPDIRNAWLEIGTEEQVNLYLDKTIGEDGTSTCELVCEAASSANSNFTDDDYKVTLNGLYKVYLELEEVQNNGQETNTSTEAERRNEIIAQVKEQLNQHRNLCEDFIADICILEQDKIGVCGTITLHETAQPEVVYLKIIQKIRQFLSPKINYYSLQEMLDKGKSIEEIYAGRPYSKESFGFLDTDKLEQIPRRTEIHQSDIYRLILSVEGVATVQDLYLNINGSHSNSENAWILPLTTEHLPVFCLENSHFNFYKGNIWLRLDQQAILQKEINTFKKVRLGEADLDSAIPQGVYRADLGNYYSIQNEFPITYGIGEGGLSPDASNQRKAQALQLKGYLLFYDQLLAAYLKQLSHIRDIFSMRPDTVRPAASRRTYFNQTLENVPDVAQLLPTFSDGNSPSQGTVLATIVEDKVLQQLPILAQHPHLELEATVAQFEGLHQQKLAMSQWQRIFRQAQFDSHLGEDSCGHFFILQSSMSQDVLLSKQRYSNKQAAQAAIENLAFVGTLEQVYRPITAKETPFDYTFELVFSDYNYYDYLQQLLENETQYCQRRNAFLDHLLARFSENFTDYAVLLYGTNEASPDSKNAKARFLSHYPDLSRNRSKAFNYLESSWNTDNVSGLEKRLKAIADIPNWGNQRLCNFDVIKLGQEFVYELRDAQQNVLLKSLENYPSEEKAKAAVQALTTAMKQADSYQKEDAAAAHTYRFSVTHAEGTAIHPTTYATEEERNTKIENTFDLFRKHVLERDIFVAQHEYSLQLLDMAEQAFGEALKGFSSEAAAQEDIETFIHQLNEQQSIELVLIPESEQQYLNIKDLKTQVKVHPIRYRWQLRNEEGVELIRSFLDFENTAVAATDFSKIISLSSEEVVIVVQGLNLFLKVDALILAKATFATVEEVNAAQESLKTIIDSITTQQAFVQHIPQVWSWSVLDADKNLLLESHYLFRNKRLAEQAWREAADESKTAEHLVVISREAGNFQIQLEDATGQVLGQSPIFQGNTEEQRAAIQTAFELKKNATFTKKEEGFAYQIINSDKQVLLVSHRLFGTASLAVQARNKMLMSGFSRDNFSFSGDELNLNYSFYLQNNAQKTIAFHPTTYGSQDEREEALNLSIATLQTYQSPLYFTEEYTAFFKNSETETSLNAVQTFNTADAAKQDFIQQLTLFAQEDRFQTFELQEETYTFGVQDEDRLFATATATYETTELRDEAIQKVLQLFKTATYQVHVSEYESHWKFRYLTKRSASDDYPWFESHQTFSHPDEAKQAWLDLVAHIHDIAVQTKQTENGQFSLILSQQTDDTLIAEHPNLFETEAPTIQAKNQAQILLNYVRHMHASTEPTDEFCAVEKTPDSQQGDLVYRLLKIDEPLAYQPHSKEANTTDWEIDLRSDFDYLQLDFEDNCIIQAEDRFHFVLRDASTQQIYFTSYQSFDNAAAAHHAFLEQYLLILQATAKKSHYIPGTLSTTVFHIHEHIKTTETGIVGVGEPLATIDGSDFPDFTVETISVIARSYPIRCTFQEEIDICKTEKTPQTLRKYCFQLWNDGTLVWHSTRCYDTPQAAQKDFDLFLSLLPHRVNHGPYFDMEGRLLCPEQVENHNETLDNQEPLYLSDCLCEQEEFGTACHYYRSITEPLLLSQRFQDLEEIWGYQEPLPDLSCEQQSVTPKASPMGIALLLEIAQEDTTFYPFRDEMRGYQHCFHVVKKDYRVGQYKQVFNTSSERNEALIELFNSYHIALQDPDEAALENDNSNKTIDIEQVRKDWNFNNSYTDEHLIELLQDPTNYQGILKEHCGLFAIKLVNPEHILATSPRCYDTLGELETAIEATKACINNEGMHLVEHILLRPTTCPDELSDNVEDTTSCLFPTHAECDCNLYVELLEEDDCPPPIVEVKEDICETDLGNLAETQEDLEAYIPGADPYSFWTTIVLPAWTKRFRQANFRDFFFQLLYEQAPAHIAFNVVWLSPWQMCAFERIYKQWLQALSSADKKACKTDINELNCQLLNCILALQNCAPDEVNIDLPEDSPCQSSSELDDLSLATAVHPSISLHCLFAGKAKPFSEIEPSYMEVFVPPVITDEPPLTDEPNTNTIDTELVTTIDASEETNSDVSIIENEETNDDSDTASISTAPALDLTEIVATAASIATVVSSLSFEEQQEVSDENILEKTETTLSPNPKQVSDTTSETSSKSSHSEKEMAQHIRQRTATYLKNIQAIEEPNIFKTASYKRTEFFLSTDGNFREYQELVKHISRYSLNRKGGVSDAHYFNLLYQATAYYLDKQVEHYPNDMEHVEDFKSLIELLQSKGMEKQQVIDAWNPVDLKAWFDEAVERVAETFLSEII